MPIVLCFFLIACTSLFSQETDISKDAHRKALYATIQPTSLRDLLLFYELYKDTSEGKEALESSWKLLSKDAQSTIPIPSNIEAASYHLIHLIEPSLFEKDKMPELSPEATLLIQTIGQKLPTRSLKGHTAETLEDIEQLPPEEVDLARALVIFEGQKVQKNSLSTIEAALDLIALHLLARLPEHASNQEKISLLSKYLFFELGVRFPPQSDANSHIDHFSELSSVLFSRRGVCLGASLLYISLAQRLEIPLTIFTPPGHIFVALQENNATHVIETTARGINLPLDQYLGLSLRQVPTKTTKEVIGMLAFNKAANLLQAKKYEDALKMYEKALKFQRQDDELAQMLSLTHLLLGNNKTSQKIASEQMKTLSPERLEHDLFLIDLAHGTLSNESANLVIEWAGKEDDQKAIPLFERAYKKNSESLILPFSLAHMYLSTYKQKKALSLLEKLSEHQDAPSSLFILLSMIYLEREDVERSWDLAEKAYQKVEKHHFVPKPLQELFIQLQTVSPRKHKLDQ